MQVFSTLVADGMWLNVVRHADRFGPETDDTDWIPVLAREGWIVLTRDRAIKRRKLERQAVIEGPLKYFSIGPSNAALPTHVTVVGNHLVSIRALAQFMPAPELHSPERERSATRSRNSYTVLAAAAAAWRRCRW